MTGETFMYKYLIVDDEPLIRMGTRKKLETLSEQITCIGEADNGEHAIQLINISAPDIIILDMEMPVMNGTQLLPYLTEHFPDIQLIVISGYKSFDYIKHAIANNVIDYILKPFTEEQIQQTILQAIERIETSESIHAQIRTMEEHRDLAYYEHDIQLLQNLLLDYPVADTNLHSQELSFLKNSGSFCLLLLYTPAPAEDLKLKEHLIQLGFSEIILYLPHPVNPCLRVFIVSMPERASYKPQALYMRFIDEFTDYIETFDTVSYWGVSEIVQELEQLHTTYSQCCTALGSMPVKQAYPSCYIYDAEAAETTHEIHWEKTDEFLFRLETGDMDKVCELLLGLQDFYSSVADFTLADVKYHYHQLTENCAVILEQYLNQPSPSGSMHNIVNEMFSLTELHSYYTRFFLNLSEMLKPGNVYAMQNTIEQIKIYTQRNYHKNITVDFLASLFYMNSSYLSHLFRRQTGQKYVQYLNEIRIKKAKELLLTTDRKLYQIARTVGYDNSKYFFRVFKKLEGITPEQFRMNEHPKA